MKLLSGIPHANYWHIIGAHTPSLSLLSIYAQFWDYSFLICKAKIKFRDAKKNRKSECNRHSWRTEELFSVCNNKNRPFHGFFNYWLGQVGKSVNITGKSALILIKLPNLKVIHLSDVCTFSDVCMTFTPHHTNICKILWLWGATSLLVFNKWLSNFVILLILRCSFQLCWQIFP